jgi:alpha/beta hydrolase fold
VNFHFPTLFFGGYLTIAGRVDEAPWNQRRAWIEKQLQSGFSAARFCHENDLNLNNFNAWKRTSISVNVRACWVMVFACVAMPGFALDNVEHKYAENDGVKIHYACMGDGPLMVFIHGFPDFWYSWRHQMHGLKDNYRVVALDTRGYNKSDKPEKQEDYDMKLLVQDVAAVIKAEGQEKAVIVGHDWGGAIAWQFATTMPHMATKLIIVNLPHPKGAAAQILWTAFARIN